MVQISSGSLRIRFALAGLLFLIGVSAALGVDNCHPSWPSWKCAAPHASKEDSAGPQHAQQAAQSARAGEGAYRLLELDGYLVKWGSRELGVGASISYAFARERVRFDGARNCRDMAPLEELSGAGLSLETLTREAEAAFRVWEGAADLSFHEVGDARHADIVLGVQGRPSGKAFANVSYGESGPDEGVRTIDQALVCLNPEHDWKVGFDGNTEIYDIRYTLVHEIGHAIGLDHPGPSGQVMAFRYTEAFEDLQPGDLRGVQRLYGPVKDGSSTMVSFDVHAGNSPSEAGAEHGASSRPSSMGLQR